MVTAFGSLTEPVGDGAALATWFLIRGARERATVFLCGHGGDEVLGGYRLSQDRFRLSALWRLAWLPEAWIRPVAERYLYGDESVKDRLARLRAARHRDVPAAARYLMHRPLPGADVASMLGAPGNPNGLDVVDRLYARCDARAGQIDRIQEVMLPTFLSENILSFADSVSMDSSAELRMPFLDRDLVDLVLALPERARVSRWPGRANTKLILREWGRRHLSDGTVTRRKRTFNFGNLPALLHEHGDTLRGYVLDAPAVRRAMPGVEAWVRQAPETFHGPWEGTLWALMALGIWSNRVGLR
jgi:asparagine synthase (glutamine-hydrolysing)